MHGNIGTTRCLKKDCISVPFGDQGAHLNDVPMCDSCGSPLVPGVVLFGEEIPIQEAWMSKKALRDCDLFLTIGTSGAVSPASNFVRSADYEGARTVYINTESLGLNKGYFGEEIVGCSEEVLLDFFN